MTDENDLNLSCIACGTVFTFTIGEQQFFRDRGLNQPRRCVPCRRAKRNEVAQGAQLNDWQRNEWR